MEINVDEIDYDLLSVNKKTLVFIQDRLDKEGDITDDLLFRLIVLPGLTVRSGDGTYRGTISFSKKPKRPELVKLAKKEFHEFLCTESEYYKKERNMIGGNINVLITVLAAAMVGKIQSLETGVATSLVATFFIMAGKMGKKMICKSFNSRS